ncbi:DUF4870 domain-containing protein [Halomarina oriensis]|uniref:DUF4870 domain-containing protein n=1 Tax=Halomarina oriensis TaxID=671145 RepID=A0A6B0GPL4_9EURY|nr:DUF4870 domain-containing protein [Halomarina oriensis]MWG36772.1 DUF4870 domain-containing protein [Halomarina oriensis]
MVSETIDTPEQEIVRTNETGMDANVMAALSYVLGFVSGLVVYLVEKEDRYVRFHAAQSMALSVLLFVASIVLTVAQTLVFGLFFSNATAGLGAILSLGLGLVWLVVGLGGFVLWLYLIVRAYQGATPRIPIAAGLADRIAG